jgi:hypothetical protein
LRRAVGASKQKTPAAAGAFLGEEGVGERKLLKAGLPSGGD